MLVTDVTGDPTFAPELATSPRPPPRGPHLEGDEDGNLGGALHGRGGLRDGRQHARARVGRQVQVRSRQRYLPGKHAAQLSQASPFSESVHIMQVLCARTCNVPEIYVAHAGDK